MKKWSNFYNLVTIWYKDTFIKIDLWLTLKCAEKDHQAQALVVLV